MAKSDKIIQLPQDYWRTAVVPKGALYISLLLNSWLAPRQQAQYGSRRWFTIKAGETIEAYKGIVPSWTHVCYGGKNGFCLNYEVSVATGLPETPSDIPF